MLNQLLTNLFQCYCYSLLWNMYIKYIEIDIILLSIKLMIFSIALQKCFFFVQFVFKYYINAHLSVFTASFLSNNIFIIKI